MKNTTLTALTPLALASTLALATPAALADEDNGLLHNAKVKILNRIVKKNIPREFNFDKMDIRVLTGIGADIDKLTISENPAFVDNPLNDYGNFAEIDSVNVRVNPLPLLIAHIDVAEMSINQPEIRVIRTRDNQFNFDDLFNAGKGPVLKWMKVRYARVNDGQLRIIDDTAPRGPLDITVKDIQAQAFDFSLKESFDTQVSLTTPGAQKGNLTIRGQAGPLLDAENFEQVPIDVAFDLKEAPIMPYMDFLPEGLTAYPVSGKVSVDYDMIGNAWDGLHMRGKVDVDNVVLSDPQNSLHGAPAHLDISVPEDMTLSLKDNQIRFDKLLVNLNNNLLNVRGTIDDIIAIPRLNLDIEGDAISILDMLDIYPFAKEYIPEEARYGGHARIAIHASGDYNSMTATGKMQLNSAFFELEDLVRKQKHSPLALTFHALLNPTEQTISATADFEMGETEFLQHEMFINGLEEMARHFQVSLKHLDFLKVNRSLPLSIAAVKGELAYENDLIRFKDLKIIDLKQNQPDGIDAIISGSINLNDNSLNLSGRLLLPEYLTDDMLRTSQQFRKLLSNNRVEIPVVVTGPIEDPAVRIALASPAQQVQTAQVDH